MCYGSWYFLLRSGSHIAYFMSILQWLPSFYQYTILGSYSSSHHNGSRCGQSQGTWTSNHQHCDGMQEGITEVKTIMWVTIKRKWLIAKVSCRVGMIAMVTVVVVTVISIRYSQNYCQPNQKCHQRSNQYPWHKVASYLVCYSLDGCLRRKM